MQARVRRSRAPLRGILYGWVCSDVGCRGTRASNPRPGISPLRDVAVRGRSILDRRFPRSGGSLFKAWVPLYQDLPHRGIPAQACGRLGIGTSQGGGGGKNSAPLYRATPDVRGVVSMAPSFYLGKLYYWLLFLFLSPGRSNRWLFFR